ncbi:MAG: GrpB family protein [Verrucomicrobiota bacterium]|jgi:GrpB-like predicted nucleotidyltransferase (UPF0157 family)
MQIARYWEQTAEFHAPDPEIPRIVRVLSAMICQVEPKLQVEHIGSTSIDGCGGKGIIDLAVLYPAGLLSRARETLDALGFQRQGGPEPFPEERPMRVGAIAHAGGFFRIHAHVIALHSSEHQELVWFRDTLRSNAKLRQDYEDFKKRILASGICEPIAYCKAKGRFIEELLKDFRIGQ